MNKFGRILWKIILLLISLPFIKSFYDIFTAPGTGLLVQAGCDETALAILTAMPWLFPLLCIIFLIKDLSTKDEPPSGGIGNFRI